MYPKKTTKPSSARPIATTDQEMTAAPTPTQPMPSSPSTTEKMERRIAELENELVKTKLEAALAQSNEEHLRLETRRLQSTIERLTLSPALSQDGGDENSYGPPKRSHRPSLPPHTLGVFKVPLADPFRRRGSQSSTSSRAAGRRAQLNPNSCASGLNFLADLAGLGPSDSSLASSVVSTVIPRKKRRTILNPASCASALDLMGLIGPAAVAAATLRPPASGGPGGDGNKNAEWDSIPHHEY
mmetsp:Transcript_1128/g.2663  ORF Transcript_1128/g.2663 Transcript_1128/m.2663 type:complete len:242 (+) Transcript_1128:51-776(+)